MSEIWKPASEDVDYANVYAHSAEVLMHKKKSKIQDPSIHEHMKFSGQLRFPIQLQCKLLLNRGLQLSLVDQVKVKENTGLIEIHTKQSIWELIAEEKNPTRVALLYLRRGYLDFEDKIPDGFFDGGRGMSFEYKDDRSLEPKATSSAREILVANAELDGYLKALVPKAESFIGKAKGKRDKAALLAVFVSDHLGGTTTYHDGYSSVPNIVDLNHAEITEWRNLHSGWEHNRVPLGVLNHGVCRQRAVLYKYLADRLGIKCRLIRGKLGSGHAWNIVKINRKYSLVDVMQNPYELQDVDNPRVANFYNRKGGKEKFSGGIGAHSISDIRFDDSSAYLPSGLSLDDSNATTIFEE